MKAIIWDIDETIYPTPTDFFGRVYRAAADTAIESGLPHDVDRALEMARDSYKTHNYSIAGFFLEHGLPRDKMEKGFMDRVVEMATICPATIAMIQNFKGPQIAVSHSVQYWVNRMLTAHGLDEAFPETHRIYAEKMTHPNAKKHSADVYLQAAQILGHEPKDILVFEDTIENMLHAKAVGMRTILITNGKEIAKPDFVDHMIDRPYKFKFTV